MMRMFCKISFLMGTIAGLHAENPCSSSPCMNKGRCRPYGEQYKCDCKVDFEGTNCEISLAAGYQAPKGAFEEEKPKPTPKLVASKVEKVVEKVVEPEQEAVQAFDQESRFLEVPETTEAPLYEPVEHSSVVRVHIPTTYLGCFTEGNYALMEGIGQIMSHATLTVDMCVVLCRFHRLTYAGLRSGVNCRCRNFIGEPSSRLSESDCGSACSGNSNQICGGSIAVTVYSSCPMGYYGYMCQHRCRCATYQCSIEDGACPSSTCKYAWSGPSCDTFAPEGGISLERTSWCILTGTSILAFAVFSVAMYFGVIYKWGKVYWKEGIYVRPEEKLKK